MFKFILDKFKTHKMCREVFLEDPWMCDFIYNRFMKMLYHELVSGEPDMIRCVPDGFKSQDMCNDAVFEDHSLIKHLTDWFVTAEMLEKCEDEEWLEGFRWHKAQKAKIKKELLPVVWHPDRDRDWCFSKHKKVRH